MSRSIAREVGECFGAIDRLRLNDVITRSEARKASRRLVRRVRDYGVGVSDTDWNGRALSNQVRVHWCGSHGQQINRYYPAYNYS